ncbi:predicted protein [Histoplasma capsulatum var. duboisii H88]|uniref:Predicted protein n=1 Tax=Ajellomyces capsulatus (strain H88) TaxID=544711 RepID=F0US80_AJEC8|nr:predicted protein [Histoplasma capsulatum var. duboisii H88]
MAPKMWHVEGGALAIFNHYIRSCWSRASQWGGRATSFNSFSSHAAAWRQLRQNEPASFRLCCALVILIPVKHGRTHARPRALAIITALFAVAAGSLSKRQLAYQHTESRKQVEENLTRSGDSRVIGV